MVKLIHHPESFLPLVHPSYPCGHCSASWLSTLPSLGLTLVGITWLGLLFLFSSHSALIFWNSSILSCLSIVRSLCHCWVVSAAWIFHNLFIHSPINGNFGGFQILTITNKSAVNLPIFPWHILSFLLGEYPVVEWPDQMGGRYLALSEPSKLLPKVFPAL